MSFNESLTKPAIASLVTFSLNKFVLKGDTKESLIFAASVGTGIAVGSAVGARVPITDSPKTWYNEKLVATRTIEVASGLGASVIVNRFVNTGGAGVLRQAGVILVADYVAEYLCDYLAGRPLGFFV